MTGRFRGLVWGVALVLPLLILRRTAFHPATNLVAARPDASPLDDPTTNATAMARAWTRWDRGNYAQVDDRVFAPVPNAIALGEYYPLPSLVGYPFARLFRSVPLGVNVPYFLLGLALFPVVLYALYAELAEPGPGALLAAVVVAYGPARMNSLGVLNTLLNAFGLLAVLAAIRYLRAGRGRDLAVFAIALFVQALSSLYGTAMSCLWGSAAVLIVAWQGGWRWRRLSLLGLSGSVVLALACWPQAPYFRLFSEVGVETSSLTFEQHAADLLSLLHGGIFGGPVRDLLQRLVPGFPLGAAAFFPTLAFAFVLVLFAFGRAGRDRVLSPLPWVALAALLFVASLGPTVRLAGRPLIPGPYALVMHLPVLSTLRGIHRYDQWFDISLGAAAALAWASLRRSGRLFRAAPAAALVLALLDLWPADVPSYRFPAPLPYARSKVLDELPPDALVTIYPWQRDTNAQSWVDQLAHGRRAVNGFFSYEPPLHTWVSHALDRFPPAAALALFRDLGVSLVVVERDRLDPGSWAGFQSLGPDERLGVVAVSELPGERLFRLQGSPPRLIDSRTLGGLRFQGPVAFIEGARGSLLFRIGPGVVPVHISTGAWRERNRLSVPAGGIAPLRVSLAWPPPRGAAVLDRSGRLLGAVE